MVGVWLSPDLEASPVEFSAEVQIDACQNPGMAIFDHICKRGLSFEQFAMSSIEVDWGRSSRFTEARDMKGKSHSRYSRFIYKCKLIDTQILNPFAPPEHIGQPRVTSPIDISFPDDPLSSRPKGRIQSSSQNT